MEKIRSDLECKTKYNKGATRDDWAMDQNEVKSKLSNPYRVWRFNPVSTIKAKRCPAYPGLADPLYRPLGPRSRGPLRSQGPRPGQSPSLRVRSLQDLTRGRAPPRFKGNRNIQDTDWRMLNL